MIERLEPFVRRGFALHWLKPRSKAPVNGVGWSSKPVATLDELRNSYREGYNVGVRPGKYSKVGGLYLHLIDVDVRGEAGAAEAQATLLKLFPSARQWPRVASGSGGASRHYYFLTDAPFASKKLAHSAQKITGADGKKHWLWEIELFGSEKQAVMPPSIHPDTGKAYRWEVEFDWDLLDMGLGPVIPAAAVPAAIRNDDPNREDDDDEDALLSMVRHRPLGMELEDILDAVMALPVDQWCEDRDGWLKVGMAIHHETGGSLEGFDVWQTFSQQSAKFDPDDAKRVWRSMRLNAREPFTMASVMAELRENGNEFERCRKRLDGVNDYRKALDIVARFDLTNAELSTLAERLVRKAELNNLVVKPGAVLKDIAAAKKRLERDPETELKALESWIAEEFLRIHFHGDRLLCVGKQFWRYEEGSWRICDNEYVDSRVYRFITKLMQSRNKAHQELLGALIASGRADTLNALISSVGGVVRRAVTVDSETDPMRLRDFTLGSVMNFRNGSLWFPENKPEPKFRKHDPDDRLTLTIEADYDPDAECPMWDAAVAGIFANTPNPQEMVDLLHEIMGYCLQTSRKLAAWFLFHGGGSNGKSFVASILQALLGHRGWTARSLGEFAGSTRNAHVEASLVGKLLVVDDDFKKGASLPDDSIKKLSEMKMMTANPKFAAEFNFVCRAAPLILSNTWPRTADLSFGLDRRAVVLPFSRTFEADEKDLSLFDKITSSEMNGVAKRCIEGWNRLRKRGVFPSPEPCEAAKQEWMGDRNAMSAFLADCVEVTGRADDRVAAEDLWTAFQRWGDDENIGKEWSRRRVLLEIAGLKGVTRRKSDGYIHFLGLRLADGTADPVVGKFEDLSDLI